MGDEFTKRWRDSVRGHWNEPRLQAHDELSSSTNLACKARFQVESGKATEAINSAWEALRAFDEHSPWTQRCLLTMSSAYFDLGFPAEATSLARQALDLSCECKFDEGRATSNIALAWTDLRRGEIQDGLSRIVHSVQVFKQSSDSFQLVRAWNDAAIFLQSMGQHRRALDVWETAFNLLDPMDEHFCTLVVGGMAASQAELGSRTGAMRTLMNCISYAERHTRPKALVTHYYDFANTLRRGGEPQKALVAAAKGQKVAAESDLFYSSENFFDLMVEEYQKMGNEDRAAQIIAEKNLLQSSKKCPPEAARMREARQRLNRLNKLLGAA